MQTRPFPALALLLAWTAHAAPGAEEGAKPLARVEGEGYAVVLVPIGEADPDLLLDVARGMAPDLGIPVLVQNGRLEMPPPTRDRYKIVLEDLRKRLRENLGNKGVKEAMKLHGVEPEDLENDVPVIKVNAELILRTDGRPASERFVRQIGLLSGEGAQWDVDDLVGPLERAAAPHARPNVAYVAVTAGDLFDDGFDFLFGGARQDKRMAAVSYCRFRPQWEGKPPDRRLVYQRLRKQCLSSVRHLFGLPACRDPRCVHAPSTTLADFDAQSASLCAACKGRFRNLFGMR